MHKCNLPQPPPKGENSLFVFSPPRRAQCNWGAGGSIFYTILNLFWYNLQLTAAYK